MSAPVEPSIPNCFPNSFGAGTTVKIDRQFSDYPNTDWTYTLYLAGASVLNQAATPDPDGVTQHIVIPAANTATLIPGAYQYVGRLTATDGEVFDVEFGRIIVEANIALLGAGDALSPAERTLTVIEAAIQGRLTADIEHYSIAGRSVSKIPIGELTKLRGIYASLVWRERNPGNLMTPVKVYFPPNDCSPRTRFREGC